MRIRRNDKKRYQRWIERGSAASAVRPPADEWADEWRERKVAAPPTVEYLAARAILRQRIEDDPA